MSKREPRSRRRRLLTGIAVSAATFAVLLVLTEVGVRLLVPPQIFSAFKERVQEEVGSEDHRTHYDLGIAYQEMGLVREG